MMFIPGTVSTYDLNVKLAHAFVAIVDMVADKMGSACVSLTFGENYLYSLTYFGKFSRDSFS